MTQKAWKDNRRILLTVPWVDDYELCDEKLIMQSGLIMRKRSVVMLYRVQDVEIHQGLFQRLAGVGDITLHTNDKTNPQLVLKGIKDPVKVMDLIIDLVEEARDKKGIRISEFSRAPGEF